jgi:hypothetical protein
MFSAAHRASNAFLCCSSVSCHSIPPQTQNGWADGVARAHLLHFTGNGGGTPTHSMFAGGVEVTLVHRAMPLC